MGKGGILWGRIWNTGGIFGDPKVDGCRVVGSGGLLSTVTDSTVVVKPTPVCYLHRDPRVDTTTPIGMTGTDVRHDMGKVRTR